MPLWTRKLARGCGESALAPPGTCSDGSSYVHRSRSLTRTNLSPRTAVRRSTGVGSPNHTPECPAAAADNLHSAIFLEGRQHFLDQLLAGGGHLGGDVGQRE